MNNRRKPDGGARVNDTKMMGKGARAAVEREAAETGRARREGRPVAEGATALPRNSLLFLPRDMFVKKFLGDRPSLS